MTQNSYLRNLSKNLKKLKYAERMEVISYYQEYLNDMPSDTDPVQALGSPEELAQEILKNYDRKSMGESEKASWLKRIILALIVLNPFVLIILLIILPFILVLSILTMVFGFVFFLVTGVIIISIFTSGFISLFQLPSAFVTSAGVGFMCLGVALLEFAVALLLLAGIQKLGIRYKQKKETQNDDEYYTQKTS